METETTPPTGGPLSDILGLESDKKRKLEGSFKIPKKKRVDEPKPAVEPVVEVGPASPGAPPVPSKPYPLSPIMSPVKMDAPKFPKTKKKRVEEVPVAPPKMALLETPKSGPLLSTPAPVVDMSPARAEEDPEMEEDDAGPGTPPNTEEADMLLSSIPKSEIIQEYVTLNDGTKHPLPRDVWRRIFGSLKPGNLAQCMKVCRVWREWLSDPVFWPVINLSRYSPLFPDLLRSVVLRQPSELDLSYSTISRRQCDWLLPKLPTLKTIRMSGLSMSIIGALNGPHVSNLYHIDLRWVDELNDWGLRDLLSVTTGREQRPRFRDLRGLRLAGCPLTDEAVNYVIKFCPSLEHLDFSYNPNMNDRVVDLLTQSALIYSLTKVDFSGCSHLTDKSLVMLKKCYDVNWVDLRSCKEITRGACVRFAHSFKKELNITEDKLIHPPTVEVYS